MKPIIRRLFELVRLLSLLLIALATCPTNALEEAAEPAITVEVERNTVYFPQFQMFETVKNEAEMSDEISGRLELVDECLRLVTSQGTYLLIWPGWYDFSIAGREIVVSKIKTNAEVAYLKIGHRLTLRGAEIVYFPATALQFKIPDSCLGPFMAVGEILSAKTESESENESYPVQKQFPNVNPKSSKEAAKPARLAPPVRKAPLKITPPARREPPKKSAQANKQLKKLEIMLEKTILK